MKGGRRIRENKKELGTFGERLVLREYVHAGFDLLQHQYRCRYGEIDLIFRKEGGIYFVEVRTKTTLHYGTAEESIIEQKKKRIKKVAEYFLYAKRVTCQFIQFDVVSVFIDKQQKTATLRRYPNAF